MNSDYSVSSRFELRDLGRLDLDNIKIRSHNDGRQFVLINGDSETKEHVFTDIYKKVKELSKNKSNTHAGLTKLYCFVKKLQEVKVHNSFQDVFGKPEKKLGKLERDLQEKISIIESLFDAAKSGNVKVLKQLSKEGADFNVRVQGATPLGSAVINGHTKAVEILIEGGAYVNFANSAGIPPLFFVLKDNRLEILKVLIEKKADLNFQNLKGQTILIRAAMDGRKEIVKILSESKLKINLRDNWGQTAFDRAWINGDKDIVEILAPFTPDGDKKLMSMMCSKEKALEKQDHFGESI
jgi:hypothetical protein